MHDFALLPPILVYRDYQTGPNFCAMHEQALNKKRKNKCHYVPKKNKFIWMITLNLLIWRFLQIELHLIVWR